MVFSLPALVRPEIMSWNPAMNVILFGSETGNLLLYRMNGEIVWTAPGRKQSAATRSFWSPNGQLLAIVYADGGYQILQQANGRLTFSSPPSSGISCLAWSQDPEISVTGKISTTNNWEFEAILNPSVRPSVSTPLFSGLPDISTSLPNVLSQKREGPHMVLGTQQGTVTFNLYGVFSLGPLQVANKPIRNILIDEDAREFAITTDDEFIILHAEYLKIYGEQRFQQLILQPARVAALIEELRSGANKYTHERKQMIQARSKFIFFPAPDNDPALSLFAADPIEALTSSILFGDRSTTATKWIDNEHENGLKRWYKSSAQSYDAMRKVLLETCLPAIQQIVVLIGDLSALSGNGVKGIEGESSANKPLLFSEDALKPALDLATDLVHAVVKHIRDLSAEHAKFHAFAIVLQNKFSSRLDRTLTIVDDNGGDQFDAVDYISDHLVHSSSISQAEVSKAATALRDEFSKGSQDAKDILRSQIKIVSRVPTDGRPVDIYRHGSLHHLLLIERSLPGRAADGCILQAIQGNKSTSAGLTEPLCRFGPGGSSSIFAASARELIQYKFTSESSLGLECTGSFDLKLETVALACSRDAYICILDRDKKRFEVQEGRASR